MDAGRDAPPPRDLPWQAGPRRRRPPCPSESQAKREKEAKAIEKPAGHQAPEKVGESDRTRRAEMMLGRTSRLLLVLLFVAYVTPSGLSETRSPESGEGNGREALAPRG